ncbi:maleate cis-trans isomerase family protein [Georgenia sp. MJ170]|uniref:maleate cis-trans isomerase family protein n=1 Tax=Georgenia sunbinii TaxID=3117728 RepID=UPI002F26719C
MTTPPTVTAGMIYPDHAAEDEYLAAAELLGVRLPVVHVYGTDLHAVPELLDLGSPERLAGGAAELAAHRPQSVMWACTSGSFVYGPAGAQRQVDQLSAVAGVPASSTSLAFVAALAELGLRRVAVAASYPDDVAALFVDYLAAAGVEVVAMASAGIDTAAEVGTLTADEVTDLAAAHDHRDAEALLVPDTAMRTLDVIPGLEARLGKPVLTANQVTVWQGLRLAGAQPAEPRLGTLFSRRPNHAHQ